MSQKEHTCKLYKHDEAEDEYEEEADGIHL